MTPAETRAAVTAYFQTRSLVNMEAMPEGLALALKEIGDSLDRHWYIVQGDCIRSCWARSHVGAVLAAGLWATGAENARAVGPLLRTFGLSGERALSGPAAWKLMQPFVCEPVVHEASLAEIRRHSQLRLNRLPEEPGPVDVLMELTRPRNGPFAVQMARWLSEYFRDHEPGDYREFYEKALNDVRRLNDRKELANLAGSSMVRGILSREDWQDMIHGQLPISRLELRAGYATTQKFLIDYWERWRPMGGG